MPKYEINVRFMNTLHSKRFRSNLCKTHWNYWESLQCNEILPENGLFLSGIIISVCMWALSGTTWWWSWSVLVWVIDSTESKGVWLEINVRSTSHVCRSSFLKHSECLGRILGVKIRRHARLLIMHILITNKIQVFIVSPLAAFFLQYLFLAKNHKHRNYVNNRMVSKTSLKFFFGRDSHNAPSWK